MHQDPVGHVAPVSHPEPVMQFAAVGH